MSTLPARRPAWAEFEDLVDVGGLRLRARVAGQGGPVVVLEAGGGSTLETWEDVQAQIARFTCVVSYDRAGAGLSDPLPPTASAARVAGALRTLLTRLGLRPPLVLVGHSLGDWFARSYEAHHPHDVAGLVLVDTRDAHFHASLLPHLPPETPGEPPALTRLRAVTRFHVTGELSGLALRSDEDAALYRTIREAALAVRERRHLGDLPLELIMRGVDDLGEALARDLPAEVAATFRRLDAEGWDRVAASSRHIRRTVAEGSGHDIPRVRPDVVVAAVQRLVAHARGEPLT